MIGKNKIAASTEMFLIVLSIFSIAYIIGQTNIVSAQIAGAFNNFPPQPGPNAPPQLQNLPEQPSTLQTPSGTDVGATPGEADPNDPFEDLEEAAVNLEKAKKAYDETKDVFDMKSDKKSSDGGDGDNEKVGASGIGGLLSGGFGGPFFGPLITGAIWGGVLALGIKFLGPKVGLSENLADALAYSFFFGGVAGGFTTGLVNIAGGKILGIGAATAGVVVGIGVAVAVFLLTYKDERVKIVTFQCLPYEPPFGGENCEKCNNDPLRACSEYRCKSLGQACAIANAGSDQETCVWVNRDDATAPIITPWDEALTEGHSYTSHETRPPSLGTRIVNNQAGNGCLKAFTPLEFGILTDGPAQCKIDNIHSENFEQMRFFFGETNYLLEEHKQKLTLPSPDAINAEVPELQNDGKYDFYVRCKDANLNENTDEYVISFCVDPSPDTTPPTIVDTSIESGSPVRFGVGEVPLEVYVNEPSQCKWSIQDKNYDDMENTMSCASSITEINAQQLYTCSATLTGIKDREETKFYFRCKDQPNKPEADRNMNVQSYEFTLRGTEPLNIVDVSPNGTVTGSTAVIPVELKVETSNGADEGVAICYFSNSGDEGTFVAMFESDNFEHKQLLTLEAGDYDYHFRCVDAGGNSAENETSFTVFIDNFAPLVTRAYREVDTLKIVTDEEGGCAYSLNSCNFNFEEGIPLLHTNPSLSMTHFAPWEPNTVYFIKCRDDFGNQPNPDQCSLIATPTNIG